MRYRSRAVFALIAVLALVGAACGGGKTPKTTATGALSGVTITFSDSVATSEQAAVQEVLKNFEDQTGAKVNLVQITAGDLPQKLKVEVASGNHTVHLF